MPHELREGAVLAGHYRLEHRIGEGGMGVVWAATNTITRRHVALKMLRGDAADDTNVRRRFLREGRAASAVQHPNVVEILDVVELEEGVPAIVMALLEGESLGQRLRRERLLSMRDTAAVMIPAISAIGTAHALGIVHRDLKPDNIFLANGHEGAITVKVLDFGIAKMAARDGEHAQTADGLTGTGAMLGTPYYMSPEQLFADETIDYRGDIWALGIILYECLSGVRPTQGENFAHIIKIIATEALVPLTRVAPTVPTEVSELVMRMLSSDKEKRPQSLREVRDVLHHYSDVMAITFGEPVLAPVRQTLGADSGGGLRRADLELLKVGEDTPSPPSSKDLATVDGPVAVPRAAPRPQTLPTLGDSSENTNSGLGLTLSGGRRPVRRYLLAAAAALVAVGAVVALRMGARSAPGAAAEGSALAPSPTASSASQVTHGELQPPSDPAGEPRVEGPIPASPAAADPARPPATSLRVRPSRVPPPNAGGASRPGSAPTTLAAAPTRTAAPPQTATGGLVEKPPF